MLLLWVVTPWVDTIASDKYTVSIFKDKDFDLELEVRSISLPLLR
jgi:hypothetical protein